MNKEKLLEKLQMLSKKTNDEWLCSLEERKIKELDFHNRHRATSWVNQLPKDTYEKFYGNKKFYSTVKLSTDYVDRWIRQNSRGRIFLDYACGNGFNAIKAAKVGAELTIGLDISNISIENARKIAQTEGVSNNTYFVQGDCENTGLPDNCIDLVICSGILHHLDLSCAFYELRRIVKPGGVILAIEALDYNPLIKLYRNITPQMRTEWEKAHIISYKDMSFASRFFDVKNIKHWHLFSIAGVCIPFTLPLLNAIDRLILKIPLLKMMSWMVTFEMHKGL